jgi:hypothetical protein
LKKHVNPRKWNSEKKAIYRKKSVWPVSVRLRGERNGKKYGTK